MNRLRLARERQGISQRELAKASGVTATSISRYETGERQLNVEKAKRIASVLSIDWIELFEPPGNKQQLSRTEGGSEDE